MGMCMSTDPTEDDEEEGEGGFQKPKYYRGRDGPKFRVLNFTRNYEYRQYEHSTWISTRIEGTEHGKASSKGEKILSRYFKGKNGPETEMILTCPLKVRVGDWDDFEREGEFVMSLPLPYENQDRPPAPSESGLYVQDIPQHFAYVSSFEGSGSAERWQEEAMKLEKVLDGEGIQYNKDACYTVRYEGPLHLGRKRHEVIFVKH